MKIPEYLDQSGLTLAGFAARVGVSEAAMSRYAAGKRHPRPDILRRIIAASDGAIQVVDLIPGTGEQATKPGFDYIDLLVPDLHGVMRGKRVSGNLADRVIAEGIRLPASLFGLDITGSDVPGTGLVLSTGDSDRDLRVADARLVPVPWADHNTGQFLMTMVEEDGSPFYAEPRNVLAGVAARLAALGCTPVIACELEFYLLDPRPDADGRPRPPPDPVTGRPQGTNQVYGMDELASRADLIADIQAAAEAQGVPADTAVTEYSPGQYEVNLRHVADPLAAADHGVLLKRIVRGVARAHGLDATFMAKPYGDQAGCGLHLHVSLVDKYGDNLFSPQAAGGSQRLHHAIGGLRATLADGMAVFAPNANSYRRFQVGSYAPLAPTWGRNNRTVALRIPGGSDAATRIEHRVAGADANPYLAIAAVLAGIHHGLVTEADPGPPITGNAYDQVPPSLPVRWPEALDRFAASTILADYFSQRFIDHYLVCKRAELAKFEAHVSDLDFAWYLKAF